MILLLHCIGPDFIHYIALSNKPALHINRTHVCHLPSRGSRKSIEDQLNKAVTIYGTMVTEVLSQWLIYITGDTYLGLCPRNREWQSESVQCEHALHNVPIGFGIRIKVCTRIRLRQCKWTINWAWPDADLGDIKHGFVVFCKYNVARSSVWVIKSEASVADNGGILHQS